MRENVGRGGDRCVDWEGMCGVRQKRLQDKLEIELRRLALKSTIAVDTSSGLGKWICLVWRKRVIQELN